MYLPKSNPDFALKRRKIIYIRSSLEAELVCIRRDPFNNDVASIKIIQGREYINDRRDLNYFQKPVSL